MKHLLTRVDDDTANAQDTALDELGGPQDFAWQSSTAPFGDPGGAPAAVWTVGNGIVGYQTPNNAGLDAAAPAEAAAFAPAAPTPASTVSLVNPPSGYFGASITDASIGVKGATATQVQQALDESGLSVTGAGIKVGVLSDSFNDLGGAAADEADGALPPASDIQVLKDLPSGGTDEGRAMMQIVHDIAPGASLAFYTAFDSEQDFANGILALAAAGCKVICDDVSYFDEPFFQNGVVAQAIQTVEAEGVTYITAAGNDASNAYQAAWTPTSGTYDGTTLTDTQSFAGSLVQTITVSDVTHTQTVPLLLEWNQPYGGATSDLEILVFRNESLYATATNVSSEEPTNPWVDFTFTASGTYQIAIENLSGPDPGLIKEIVEGDGLPVTINGANVGSVFGHAMTPGAITVGAVNAADTPAFGVNLPTSESFSSSGAGTELLFTNNGTALSSPDVLSPVAVSGVDNINTTVSDLSDFFGTSAATASLAGVAALMLSADPNLTPAQVEQLMEQIALPMANSAVSGAGLVQVDPAVAAAEQLGTPTVAAEQLRIQDDYLAITRTVLPLDQAIAVADSIIFGTQTEAEYVNSLLSQVADTTVPAVAVEGSMYGAVGTSAEITSLVTNFLPAQITYATQLGLNLAVFACEALGLVFAFGNENGQTTFANNYGPSNPSMPDTPAGDAAFAAAASSAIFGSQSTPNLVNFITSHFAYWENLYTAKGLPGIPNATSNQIDLAARGAAWGDVLGVALANNLGPLLGQTTNFLEDAAQGTAVYSASLTSQPTAASFQGAATASAASATAIATPVQMTGVAAHTDHAVT